MNNLDYGVIGRKLKVLRTTQGFTQEDLARRIGCNPSHISNIENNRVKVSLTALVGICNALHTSVDYVLCDEYRTDSSALDQAILLELQGCSLQDKKRIYSIIKLLLEDPS